MDWQRIENVIGRRLGGVCEGWEGMRRELESGLCGDWAGLGRDLAVIGKGLREPGVGWRGVGGVR